MPTVEILIERWQAGQQQAAEALYNLHRDQTLRLAYAILGDLGDAEEVTQDALAYALDQIGRYDPGRARFSTWLHTITVSRCRNQLKRRRLARFWLATLFGRPQEPATASPSPEQLAARQETERQVQTALQALSPSLREVIVLRYWGGQTYREIAEITGCPLPTAQSRARLAFEQLRRLLEPAALAGLMEEQGR
jgi:RNA polymerase sigma-70 factor, ECF subfamily